MNNKSFLNRALGLLLALAILPAAIMAQTFDEGPELDKSKDYYAAIVTSMGTLKLKLFPDVAPVTVKNFVNLAEGTREFTDPKNGQKAKRPYYNGTIMHRVIPDFMIQMGDPTGTGRGDPGYRFKDEFADLKFDKPGILAMANAGPGTNGSQIFVTEVPTPHLNGRHTIFGELVNPGDIEIVKKIARVPQNAQNKPLQAVTLERVEIIRVDKGTPADKVTFPAGGAAPKAEEKKEAPKAEETKKEG